MTSIQTCRSRAVSLRAVWSWVDRRVLVCLFPLRCSCSSPTIFLRVKRSSASFAPHAEPKKGVSFTPGVTFPRHDICLLINSIGSKRFKLKAQSMHQTQWDKICPEKQQQQNVFFYPTLVRQKILKTFTYTEDEKLQLQFKFLLIRSYTIKIKNQTVNIFVLE